MAPNAGVFNRVLEGIVVHARNFGESHRVIELLTVTDGRVPLLARGARASKKRFVGVLDLFISVRAQVVAKGELWSMSQADLVHSRVSIRHNLACFERATMLVECARSLSPERGEASDIYQALTAGLDALANGQCSQAARAYQQLLVAAGLAPSLHRCCRCAAYQDMAVLDGPSGGALCQRCVKQPRAMGERLLHAFGNPELLWDEALAAAVEELTLTWVEMHTGVASRSRAAIAAMRAEKL